MIKAHDLQLGDYVLIQGKPRQVEAITKRKIGYHVDKQKDNRLYYARLCEVEPIEIKSIELDNIDRVIIVNQDMKIDLSPFNVKLTIESVYKDICTFSNIFGERLILRRMEVHLLQRILRNLE